MLPCPSLPLSAEERKQLDMYRSAAIPAMEAALTRYAPPEWLAYYTAALEYMRDESQNHDPEESPGNTVLIEARLTPDGIQLTPYSGRKTP